jgi:spermidine synthase
MQDERVLLSDDVDLAQGVQLWRRVLDGKEEYELVVNGVFIMATYNALSSELLVRNDIQRSSKAEMTILIGGLGLGYSVKEAAGHPGIKAIDVVEINDVVIRYNNTVLHGLNGHWLGDERVHIIRDDFMAYVKKCGKKYDIICMDIDNGPMLISYPQNSEAYSPGFFADIDAVLAPAGVFVIWSCGEQDGLLPALAARFPRAEIEEITECHDGRKDAYYLYFAEKAACSECG